MPNMCSLTLSYRPSPSANPFPRTKLLLILPFLKLAVPSLKSYLLAARDLKLERCRYLWCFGTPLLPCPPMECSPWELLQHCKSIRRALMMDQTQGPSSPALCSHRGQTAIGQGPTRQDMVQQPPPTHVPQPLVHTGLMP